VEPGPAETCAHCGDTVTAAVAAAVAVSETAAPAIAAAAAAVFTDVHLIIPLPDLRIPAPGRSLSEAGRG
jgi:hypothetical protein